jgi:ribose-phosphate pyrophosphokinase
MPKPECLIFSGSASRALGKSIGEELDLECCEVEVQRFSDGEIHVKIPVNVRGHDVFVVQSTCAPVNDHLVELLLILDAMKRASAEKVAAVIPYFGYARQDRKDQPRVALSAKLVANLITAAGADRVLTVDLHSGQIQGFFDIPLDNLYAGPLFIDFVRRHWKKKDIVVVSPDMGNVKRARAYANHLGAPLAIIDKDRPRANVSKVMHILGEPIQGRHCLIFDDIIDTAGTLCNAADALKRAGAAEISALCTHGVLSGPAFGRIEKSLLGEVYVTDTIPLHNGDRRPSKKVKALSIASLFAEAIERIYEHRSVSALFEVK